MEHFCLTGYFTLWLKKATVGTDAYAFISVQKDRIKFICSKLIESIEGYPNHSGGFDAWHESKCAQIIDRMNAPYGDGNKVFLKARFTYGQAQKWVNMTLKYLWLLDMLPNGLSEAELHVPVDSFILEALKGTQAPAWFIGEHYGNNDGTQSRVDKLDCARSV